MAYQTKLEQVLPKALTADGGIDGSVQIENSSLFKLNQIVILKATGVDPLTLRIRRVKNPTTIIVGPLRGDDKEITDVSAFTVALTATVEANEQNRPIVPEQEIERHTFEDEPVVARRVILVDQDGNRYSVDNPLPTQLSDGSINIGSLNANLEVQLSHLDDIPNLGDIADSVRVGDGINVLKINPDGSINISLAAKSTPTIQTVVASLADTEYQIVIPQATKTYRFRNRGTVRMQYSFISGNSGSSYITVKPGNIEVEENLQLNSNLTIYFQTPKDGQEIEVLLWS